MQSAQIDLFWFRILVFLQYSVFASTFMFYQLKWEVKSVPSRQFTPSLTENKPTNLKRKNPTRFSLDQKKQIVDLHHKKVSNLCPFTECYCLLYAYVCVHLFAFSCYADFLVFCSGVFLTPRIVAVPLAVRNGTSTTNSLDLLLGIKRMGEQADKVPGLFSNKECTDIQ